MSQVICLSQKRKQRKSSILFIRFLTPRILFRHSFSQKILNSSYSILMCHLPVTFINGISLVIGKKTEYNQSTIKVQSIQKPKRDILFFVFCFFIRVFYHTHSHLTGQQGKEEGHSFSILQYHPLTNIQTFILLRCLTPIFGSITLLLPD